LGDVENPTEVFLENGAIITRTSDEPEEAIQYYHSQSQIMSYDINDLTPFGSK
jgi:hypothetical protein